MLCMILATDMDYGIGKNNTLPWHCSADLMVFKALTKDQVIAMGHNTWKSLPKKPLPDRDHIVLSRNPELKLDYPRVEHLKSVYHLLDVDPELNVWVIGGADIFEAIGQQCTYIHHTLIPENYYCDTHYRYDEVDIKLISQVQYQTSDYAVPLQFSLYYNEALSRNRDKSFEIDVAIKRENTLLAHSRKVKQERSDQPSYPSAGSTASLSQA